MFIGHLFSISDESTDVQAGHMAGCDAYLIKTGQGKNFEVDATICGRGSE